MSYATSTSVPVDRSRAEIESLLRRYGASQFVSGWNVSRAAIGFVIGKLSVRFELPLPNPNDDDVFAKTPAGRRRRNAADQMRAWEQACRSRWRALLLVIKAKLEAVEVGISTVEQEFLAWTVVHWFASLSRQEKRARFRAAETFCRRIAALLPQKPRGEFAAHLTDCSAKCAEFAAEHGSIMAQQMRMADELRQIAAEVR